MNPTTMSETVNALSPMERPHRRPFAFCGRVSTEDQQDPEASRTWQLSRARSLIEPVGGIITAEFSDIGLSRALPWKRRPEANRLLTALRDPNRGFAAVVIGEPQRAFYGNQFGLTFPLFVHYGVELWVPEVGGAIDPGSDAHDLVMALYGGMSKGERNRIKIRVRAAMGSQAHTEGRFLGGRPPYGYRLVDAGPHPNPAKAADGKRLHRLEPDPQTAPVVKRITPPTWPGRASTPSPRPSPATTSPVRQRMTLNATSIATAWRGPRAPCARSCSTPATPATRSGTANARTKSCSTSTTSPSDTPPNCAGTPPRTGSGPPTPSTNP